MTNIYKQDVSRFYQPLSSTEQLVMYGKMKDGHADAREAIINSCLPLVIDLEDMIQEGNIALMKAVDNWDIKKGNLTTVATWCIRSALIDLITDARYNVKHAYNLSRRAAIELRKVKRSSFTEVEDIANDIGLTNKRVRKLLSISPAGTGRVPYDCEGWVPEITKGRGSRRRQQADSFSQLIVEDEPTSHKPCVGDLISLINTNLEGDQKTIFCLWAGVNSKKIGPKEIARSLGKTEKYVYDTIYGAKRILSRAAKG